MEAPTDTLEAPALPQQPPVLAEGAPSIPPSPTLYLQNLSEKIKKAALKKALYSAFSPYGKVIDIVHCRTESLRGQAWVVFNNVASATTAMGSMQSFLLFDRPLVSSLPPLGLLYGSADYSAYFFFFLQGMLRLFLFICFALNSHWKWQAHGHA